MCIDIKLNWKRMRIIGIVLLLLALGSALAQNIAFAMHTVHNKVLKMTAQLNAQTGSYPATAKLEINMNGSWDSVSVGTIINPGWTVPFRVNNWDTSKDISYRVVYNGSTWAGVVRKDPIDKETIVVAAFTGNSRQNGGGSLSKQDIVNNMITHAPDLLVFTGDQVYPHNDHYTYWLEFGATFGELFRDIPVVSLPDDHDVGQGNLFGEGGIAGSGINGYNNGGYVKSADYVKEVERAQTSHLPDPYDPTPVAQGIGVYYTQLNVGGVSFAIIEDRKFKSGPQGVVPDAMWQSSGRPDHIKLNTAGYTPDVVDVTGAVLLGDRQLNFLETWAQDWTGVEMKSVLSATIFANSATHHSADGELVADLDSNGWPQTGRNKALAIIRKAFAVMIAGDQHLSSLIHHGIDEFGDAGYSFCVPSIANYYPRSWFPDSASSVRDPNMPTYIGNQVNNVGTVNHAITGNYLDGFGNKIKVWAVANPVNRGVAPTALLNWAPGYGIIKFNKAARTITMENWPRQANPQTDSQYEGWPLTVSQEDNYGRNAVEMLPTLDIRGMEDPVVQVINESTQEIEYTLRIDGTFYNPRVFASGLYTIKVGELGTPNTVTKTGVQSLPLSPKDTLVIQIGGVPIQQDFKKTVKTNTILSSKWMASLKLVQLTLPTDEKYVVDIVDVKGRTVVSREMQGPGNFFMSIPNLNKGNYLVKLKGGGLENINRITVVQ